MLLLSPFLFVTGSWSPTGQNEVPGKEQWSIWVGSILLKEQWKLLADRIEDKLGGQCSLLAVEERIESLATHYANVIRIRPKTGNS